ncbi:MAG: hypothetical protein EPN98_21515 [Phenylobacterium sp.]|uniref:hypothetical protein n=1 Tax=Phenylobacterium sp. TaxID=1871053 RepID=UPI0012142391|nr:hypothetical protein [Phenylobacterium sp.]TAL29023.1 MAG: hypothetical protein EPN98_21515 [Phenylobacterium sp.]
MSSSPDFGRGPGASLAAIGATADPRRKLRALHPAKVVKYGGGLVDLVPDDTDLPSMPAVPLRHGIPGLSIDAISPGTSILVGWGGGDPSAPYCALWSGSEGGVTATWNGDMITLGASLGAVAPVTSDPYLTAESAYLDAVVVAVTAALTALGLGGAASTLAAAQAAFKAQASRYSATNVLVK